MKVRDLFAGKSELKNVAVVRNGFKKDTIKDRAIRNTVSGMEWIYVDEHVLKSCTLNEITIKNCFFDNIVFSDVEFLHTNFGECVLGGVRFFNSTGNLVDFIGTKFYNCAFSSTGSINKLQSLNFIESTLSEVNFSGLNISCLEFRLCDIRKSRLASGAVDNLKVGGIVRNTVIGSFSTLQGVSLNVGCLDIQDCKIFNDDGFLLSFAGVESMIGRVSSKEYIFVQAKSAKKLLDGVSFLNDNNQDSVFFRNILAKAGRMQEKQLFVDNVLSKYVTDSDLYKQFRQIIS